MIEEENIELLLFQYREGLLDAAERDELERAMEQHPEWRELAESYDPSLTLPAGATMRYERAATLRDGGPKAASRRKKKVPLWIPSSAAAAVLLLMGIGLLMHDGSVGPQKGLTAAAEPEALLPFLADTLQEENVLQAPEPGSSDALSATDLLRTCSGPAPTQQRKKEAMTAEVAPESFQEAPMADTLSYPSLEEAFLAQLEEAPKAAAMEVAPAAANDAEPLATDFETMRRIVLGVFPADGVDDHATYAVDVDSAQFPYGLFAVHIVDHGFENGEVGDKVGRQLLFGYETLMGGTAFKAYAEHEMAHVEAMEVVPQQTEYLSDASADELPGIDGQSQRGDGATAPSRRQRVAEQVSIILSNGARIVARSQRFLDEAEEALADEENQERENNRIIKSLISSIL